MTPLLLDTQAYLWFVFDDPRLSETAAAAISRRSSDPLLSIASLWEITIKRQLGKLDLGRDLPTFFRSQVEERRVTVLPLDLTHLVAYDGLPPLHRDPFDRLLIAQAKTLGAAVATADPNLGRYGLEIIW